LGEQVAAPIDVMHGSPAGFGGLIRNRNYALLWFGQLVSETGNRFHWVAISLWIYSLTQSATSVSLAIASMFVGGLAVGVWAGALTDRLNRKWILVAADVGRAMLVAAIPWLMQANLWLVYLDLALVSIATSFFRPAIFALIPKVVSRKDLLPANSFFSAMDTGTEILGPIMAGYLAVKYEYALLLYLDAASYLISAALILLLQGTFHGRPPGEKSFSLWAEVIEGVRYIRRDRLQWGLFVLIFPAYLVGSGMNALQTPLAKGVIGITDDQFGTFNSIWGMGFLVASLVLGWFGSLVSRSALILGGFFLQYLFTVLMGVSNGIGLLYTAGFLVGFANTMSYVGLSTVLMEHTPSRMLGRVVSTRQVALHSVRILSPLAFGALAEVLGVRQAILMMTAVGALGTFMVVLVTGLLSLSALSGLGRVQIAWGRVAPVDANFDASQQGPLNLTALAMLAVLWTVLASRDVISAACLVIAAASLAYLGQLGRRRGWFP
jgi:MFS family permease